MKIVSHKSCRRALREYNEETYLTDRHICALKGPLHGICFGDSGGPLVLRHSNELIGVVSFGLPCAEGVPDVFTRVSKYIGWIKSQVYQHRLPDAKKTVDRV